MKPLLRVDNLTKRYGRLMAVEQVSFSVYEGEILGLIGPNGAGKTTVFECLCGVRPADQMQVLDGSRQFTATELNSVLFYLPDAIAPWPSQTVSWALDFVIGFFVSSYFGTSVRCSYRI